MALISPLISPAQLLAGVQDYSVIDCRFSLADSGQGAREYAAGHIPGAHYCHLEHDLSGPLQPTGGRHPLPDPQHFCDSMAALGVGVSTPVVVYDDSRAAFASRLWWMLNALGFTQVQVLDGGWGGWQAADAPVSSATPEPAPLTAHRADSYAGVVEFEDIGAALAAGAVLIDAREEVRYSGAREPIDPVAGHIPGALNYPWQEATNRSGGVLPVADHRERWQDLIDKAPLLVYCGSGVTACVNLLSLALAGRNDAQLYAGSWSDWCARLPPPRD